MFRTTITDDQLLRTAPLPAPAPPRDAAPPSPVEAFDEVDAIGEDSFPASDPPAWWAGA